MLALVAGQGDLPRAVAEAQAEPPLVCALEGQAPQGLEPDLTFRLETLGSLVATLVDRGVTQVCLCGAYRRHPIDPAAIDAATAPLVPRLAAALGAGDDGALRIVIEVFEEAGLSVLGAHEAAPALLMTAGVPTRVQPDVAPAGLKAAIKALAEMGEADLGQSCIFMGDRVILREDQAGTDALLDRAAAAEARGGVLYKAPKPGQDRRADLPTIGPRTVTNAAEAGLSGIVIEAGGVIVLDQPEVLRRLDAGGLFLWVRD